MTRVSKTPILAVLVLTAGVAVSRAAAADTDPPASKGNPLFLPKADLARDIGRPDDLVAKSPAPTRAGSEFCGEGEILVVYDEDANGNRIPGSERYDCVYD